LIKVQTSYIHIVCTKEAFSIVTMENKKDTYMYKAR